MIGNFSMRVMSCLRVIVTQKQLARSAEEILRKRHTEAAREICNKTSPHDAPCMTRQPDCPPWCRAKSQPKPSRAGHHSSFATHVIIQHPPPPGQARQVPRHSPPQHHDNKRPFYQSAAPRSNLLLFGCVCHHISTSSIQSSICRRIFEPTARPAGWRNRR